MNEKLFMIDLLIFSTALWVVFIAVTFFVNKKYDHEENVESGGVLLFKKANQEVRRIGL